MEWPASAFLLIVFPSPMMCGIKPLIELFIYFKAHKFGFDLDQQNVTNLITVQILHFWTLSIIFLTSSFIQIDVNMPESSKSLNQFGIHFQLLCCWKLCKQTWLHLTILSHLKWNI